MSLWLSGIALRSWKQNRLTSKQVSWPGHPGNKNPENVLFDAVSLDVIMYMLTFQFTVC